MACLGLHLLTAPQEPNYESLTRKGCRWLVITSWVRTTLSFNLHGIALADLRGAAAADRTWFEALCANFLFFFMTAWTKQQFLRKAVCQPKTPDAFSWINCKPTKLNAKLLDKINYENRFSSVCFKQANGINGIETHTVWKHCKSSFAYFKPLHTAVIQPTDKIKTISLNSCYG